MVPDDEAARGPVGGRTEDSGAGAVAAVGREDASPAAEGLMVPETLTLANAGSEGREVWVGTDETAVSVAAVLAVLMSTTLGVLSTCCSVGDDMVSGGRD